MAGSINKIIAYFDLQSKRRGQANLQAESDNLTVLPQYAALVFGILVQPFLEVYRVTGAWAIDWNKTVGWAVFALLIALIVFPSVYRKTFDAQQPKFVQFCVIFVAGIGWKAVFATATKLTGS